MKIIANRKPLVSEVESWDRIFHDANVAVYEASNYYDYYKVVPKSGRAKLFFGESAWMNAQRYATDHSFMAYGIFD